jgi:uncharacterized membrane protein YccC
MRFGGNGRLKKSKGDCPMVRTNEIRKGDGQIEFSLAALEATQLQPRARAMNRRPSVAERALTPYEVSINGIQVLIGLAFGMCFVSLFVWGVVRHWLF